MFGAVFRGLPLCLLVFLALCTGMDVARGQLPGLQGLQGLQGVPNVNFGSQTPSLTPNVQTYSPVDPSVRPLAPPSRLEDLYSNRAGRPLTQFGYEVLGVPSFVTSAQLGAVQDNYILGPGDEISVVMRGE